MRTLILLLPLSGHLLMPQAAWGISIALAWDPPARGAPDGYRMFYRFDGQDYDYSHPAWQGPELTCWIRNLPDTRIRFVVRAYNAAGESGDSNEATYTPTSRPILAKPGRTQISLEK